MSAEAGNAMTRRSAIKAAALGSLLFSLGQSAPANSLSDQPTKPMKKITCIIRYQIDPFQRDAFKQYCETWGRVIPRCGGHLVGYFLPSEGTNDVAWGLIAFDSLSAYEAYRVRLKADPEGRANFEMSQSKKLVLREERNFVETVDGTLGIPPAG